MSLLLKVLPEAIPGWAYENHAAAYKALRQQCKQRHSSLKKNEGIKQLCHTIIKRGSLSANEAKKFFEASFDFYKNTQAGFVTGYFQPVIEASLHADSEYTVPLYSLPRNMQQLPSRGEVMDGALKGKELELVFLKNPIDAFFIAIQGSARLRLKNGRVAQLKYAGKSGHPYTPIGKHLIASGEINSADMSMQAIRNWLINNPEKRDNLLRQNQSYIFFSLDYNTSTSSEPTGAAGIPLQSLRSLAVDPKYHAYGSLVFVSGKLPFLRDDKTIKSVETGRIFLAHDTGSAIKGRARGDIYFGSGAKAGNLAGSVKHKASFYELRPKPSNLTIKTHGRS